MRKIVLQRFHKQLKVFEKAELKRIPVRKPWDHVINLRGFYAKKRKDIFDVMRKKRGSERICRRAVEEKVYQALKVTLYFTSVLCKKEEWKENNGIRLQIPK